MPVSLGRILVYAMLLPAAVVTTAKAEVFVLKSGGRVEAEFLNPKREPGQPYQLRTGDGLKLVLADSAVQRVIVKTDLDKQYEAMLPKVANTVEAHWNMAEWCKEAGLTEERKKHLAAVIGLDPNHTEARKALGYHRYGTRWLTPDEYMQNQGFVRVKGAWKLRQEVEIETEGRQQELSEKQWRRDIRRWVDQVASGGRNGDAADRALSAINDPNAAPALAEILADSSHAREVRLRCLAILAKLPPDLATGTLINLAMGDADDRVADACMEELKREGSHLALPRLISELKSKDNGRVNRAADCLRRVEDKDATLPLINALITEHQFQVQQGGAPGSISPTFSPNGGGGLSMGGKPKIVKENLKNSSVRSALTTLYPGVNHNFDVPAWRSWYTKNQTTNNIDLRREQ